MLSLQERYCDARQGLKKIPTWQKIPPELWYKCLSFLLSEFPRPACCCARRDTAGSRPVRRVSCLSAVFAHRLQHQSELTNVDIDIQLYWDFTLQKYGLISLLQNVIQESLTNFVTTLLDDPRQTTLRTQTEIKEGVN